MSKTEQISAYCTTCKERRLFEGRRGWVWKAPRCQACGSQLTVRGAMTAK